MRIVYERKASVRKSQRANEVRRCLEQRGTIALHLTGGPGSGRTSLIERTASWCRGIGLPTAALCGSQTSQSDADRFEAAGLPAIPVVARRDYRLTAASILNHLGDRELFGVRLVLIEDSGDLVCPKVQDLGENARVALLSVPEGDDKPLKYPRTFERADLVVITKIDMLGLTDFDVERAAANAKEVAPGVGILRVSCRTGEGLASWYDWLREKLPTVVHGLRTRVPSLPAEGALHSG